MFLLIGRGRHTIGEVFGLCLCTHGTRHAAGQPGTPHLLHGSDSARWRSRRTGETSLCPCHTTRRQPPGAETADPRGKTSPRDARPGSCCVMHACTVGSAGSTAVYSRRKGQPAAPRPPRTARGPTAKGATWAAARRLARPHGRTWACANAGPGGGSRHVA